MKYSVSYKTKFDLCKHHPLLAHVAGCDEQNDTGNSECCHGALRGASLPVSGSRSSLASTSV